MLFVHFFSETLLLHSTILRRNSLNHSCLGIHSECRMWWANILLLYFSNHLDFQNHHIPQHPLLSSPLFSPLPPSYNLILLSLLVTRPAKLSFILPSLKSSLSVLLCIPLFSVVRKIKGKNLILLYFFFITIFFCFIEVEDEEGKCSSPLYFIFYGSSILLGHLLSSLFCSWFSSNTWWSIVVCL